MLIDAKIRSEVELAEKEPKAYVARFGKRLAARGITKPVKGLAAVALVDALAAKGRCFEVDWKEAPSEIAGLVRALEGVPIDDDEETEQFLHDAGATLSAKGLTLCAIDIGSDSYPLVVAEPADLRELKKLAKLTVFGGRAKKPAKAKKASATPTFDVAACAREIEEKLAKGSAFGLDRDALDAARTLIALRAPLREIEAWLSRAVDLRIAWYASHPWRMRGHPFEADALELFGAAALVGRGKDLVDVYRHVDADEEHPVARARYLANFVLASFRGERVPRDEAGRADLEKRGGTLAYIPPMLAGKRGALAKWLSADWKRGATHRKATGQTSFVATAMCARDGVEALPAPLEAFVSRELARASAARKVTQTEVRSAPVPPLTRWSDAGRVRDPAQTRAAYRALAERTRDWIVRSEEHVRAGGSEAFLLGLPEAYVEIATAAWSAGESAEASMPFLHAAAEVLDRAPRKVDDETAAAIALVRGGTSKLADPSAFLAETWRKEVRARRQRIFSRPYAGSVSMQATLAARSTAWTPPAELAEYIFGVEPARSVGSVPALVGPVRDPSMSPEHYEAVASRVASVLDELASGAAFDARAVALAIYSGGGPIDAVRAWLGKATDIVMAQHARAKPKQAFWGTHMLENLAAAVLVGRGREMATAYLSRDLDTVPKAAKALAMFAIDVLGGLPLRVDEAQARKGVARHSELKHLPPLLTAAAARDVVGLGKALVAYLKEYERYHGTHAWTDERTRSGSMYAGWFNLLSGACIALCGARPELPASVSRYVPWDLVVAADAAALR